ncbi:MAG: hypothetical protein LBE92_21320 [Chryseobacterium sp.]|jgi:hypothetical protein|uniref:hypothetical protein n=1 Tax=Chryseobacterium sp. TaxID=1871047 RepID=UPI00282F5A11|nr:hypothetical protein [Chryseobacterium sp.]MDR2238667.1 hypothetical protein [Chryseobacterium sp.]
MDQTKKYLYLKYKGKNAYEWVLETTGNGKMPLHGVTKIREIFPFLSLAEAKEIVVIATSQYKSLHDYQEDVFKGLEENDPTNESPA